MAEAPSKAADTAKKNGPEVKDTWYRVGYVEVSIYQEDGTIKTEEYDGLDFKFKITQILGRMPEGNMSVSICGLSHDTANKIVTLCNTAEALAKRKTVRVFAGYRDPNNEKYKGKCIAMMDVINATITSPPPDIWLQITGVYAGFLNNQNIAIDIANIKPFEKTTTENVDKIVSNLGTGVGLGLTAWNMAGNALDLLQSSEDRGNWEKWKKMLATNIAGNEKKTAEYIRLKEDLLPQIIEHLNTLAKLRDADPQKQIKYTYKIKLSKSNYKRSQYKTIGGFYQDYDHKLDMWDKTYQIPGRTRRFRYIGTIAKLPTKISETYKVNAMWEYVNEKEICLAVYSDPKYSKGIDPEDLDFIGAHNVKFLSTETGLIGIPKLKDSIELQCRFLLDENISAGDYVCVNSVLMDAINAMGQVIKTKHGEASVYQIMKITYTGHLRGNEWYCDVCARRPMDIQTFKAPPKPRTFWLTDDLKSQFSEWDVNEKTGEMRFKNRHWIDKATDWMGDTRKSIAEWAGHNPYIKDSGPNS